MGASLAEGLLQFLGLGAFLVPVLLGYLGIRTLLPRGEERLLWRVASGLWLLLLLCSLLAVVQDGGFAWKGAGFELAGGLPGKLFGSFFYRYLNHVGSVILLSALLLLFVLFKTEFSLSRLVTFLAHFLKFAVKEVRIKVTHYQKSKAKEKMRKKVVEKYTQTPEKVPAADRRESRKKGRGAEEEDEPEEEEKPKPKREEKKEIRRAEPVVMHPPAPPRPDKLLFPEMEQKGDYKFPPFTLLDAGAPSEQIDKNELYEKKTSIEEKLREFKVEGEVKEYHPGPGHHHLRVLSQPGDQGQPGGQPVRRPVPGPRGRIGPDPADPGQVVARRRDPEQQAGDHQAPGHHPVGEVPQVALQADHSPWARRSTARSTSPTWPSCPTC